ncbi:MAG: hypothetical protein M0P61_08930 [Ignavibacteriaceae bacterium]|nr:hypothetical protein [Ignavibacteriaceae bacterium]
MARYKIFFLVLFFLPITFAQSYPDQHVDFLLKKGIGSIMEQNYDQAGKTFQTLDQAYPNLPFGKLYMAAVLITKANDLAIPFETEKIEKYLEEAESIVEKNNDKKSLWTNFFFGMVKGYRAYFSSVQGKWFSTFAEAINAVNYFENCLKIDSSFNEALIAIGTYKYWKSVKAAWLPFFADEKIEGIQLLNKGIERESYNYVSGVVSLLWIYIDQKKSLSAISLAEETLKKYPNNRSFKWALARAYEDVSLSKAIELHYELLVSYASEKQANRINEIVLKHKIAQDYERQGEYDKAFLLCNEILFKKKFTNYEKQILGERLERIIALRKKLTTLEKDK